MDNDNSQNNTEGPKTVSQLRNSAFAGQPNQGQPLPGQQVPPAQPVQPLQQPIQPIQPLTQPIQQPVQPIQPAQPLQQPVQAQPAPERANKFDMGSQHREDNHRTKVKRGGGCGRLSCKTIGCLGCFLPILLIVLVLLLFIIQPSQVWEPFKRFMNEGIDTAKYTQLSKADDAVDIEKRIDEAQLDQTNNIATVELSEGEFASLLKGKVTDSDHVYIDIDENKLTFLINTDDSGEPFFVELEFDEDEDKLALKRVGTGRGDLPQSLTKFVEENLTSGLEFINLDDSSNLLSKVVSVEGASIVDLKFADEKLVITAKK